MSVVLDTRESNLGSQQWLWSHIWFIMTLLQNAADITKKWDKSLLYSASSLLLPNATALLQNVAVFSKCDDFIMRHAAVFTKCVVYYRMHGLYDGRAFYNVKNIFIYFSMK